MMVDPDGTLDALSNLSLSPLADQKLGPETLQGASAVHPGAEAALSSQLSAPRPEGRSNEPCGSSEQTKVAKRDPGTQQLGTSYK